MKPLSAYLSRLLDGSLEKSLSGPLLWVEPKLPPGKVAPTFQFRTDSGVGTPTPAEGDPYVLEIRKHKNNAFQRGITVGRTANNDLVVFDGSVSRFHAWFQHDASAGTWALADAGSKNGTKVGRTRLPAKKPQILKGGERLRFGKVEATFLMPRDFVAALTERLKG